MAFTFNGFGTKFYGEADLRSDGSFVTTEWVTALYVPLIPLRSFRFVRVRGGVNVVVFQSQSYAVLEKLPIYWPQVGRVYAFVIFAAAWWAAMAWLFLSKFGIFDGQNGIYLIFPFIAVQALPFCAAWWFRRRAFRAQQGTLVSSEPPLL